MLSVVWALFRLWCWPICSQPKNKYKKKHQFINNKKK